MRIIKNGNEKIFVTTCDQCSSDLEYCLSDITEAILEYGAIEQLAIRKRTYNADVIICPVCRNKIEV